MPSPAEFTFKINRVRAFFQHGVTSIVLAESVKHFKNSFADEGFTDVTLKKWPDISQKAKDRKRKRNGDLPPILTDTGDLGNSVTGTDDGRNVTISSDKAYAARHNEGLHGMKKRQFMGPSKVLDKKIADKLNKELRRRFGL